MQADKITALYCRYSADDMKGESDSIAHQKAILTDYANEHGFTNQRYYIDDGISGTTFERAGFKEMLKDIENGFVRTVIVKDMSRFGRNYLLVGHYLEMVFPEYNIRFIAIGDNVDSDKGINDILPFSNIMNEWYARDISRKVRAVVQNKGNSGERTTSNAIYGYKKDPNDSKKWIIDEYAANVIRRIFDMYTSGCGFSEISRTLTEERILRPTAHMGYKIGVRCDDFDDYFWHYSTIRSIIRKQEYCGDTVNFRTTKVSYKLHKKINNPKEKIKIFRDTHEAIISREQFEEAQRILNGRKRKVPSQKKRSLYYDFLFCGACKHKMMSNTAKLKSENDEPVTNYICTLAHKKKGSCTFHRTKETLINECVIEQINKLLELAKSDRKAFERFLRESSAGNANSELQANISESEEIIKRIAEIDNYVKSLFESKVKGEIDAEMFCTFSENYRNEKAELKEKLENLIEKRENLKADANRGVKLGTSVNKYDTISEVTPEILRDFIEKIEIDDYTSGKVIGAKSRRINVFFIGIGEFPLL